MKLIVFLSGLLLHFLLLHWTESVEEEKVNLISLDRIIYFFEQNYTIKTAGDPEPYAVAINVPKNQCNGSFDPSNFLTQENTTNVTDAIYNNDNHFYEGTDLIAAGLRPLKDIENSKINPVSYLLKSEAAFTKLLKRRNDSCVVIYSVYSPCKTMSGSYNITPELKNLKNHSGIKAFVFSKVYGVDKNDHKCSDFAQNCKEIVEHVPLYRCE
ncbi:hypothetical protein ABG768_007222 [Culter alburnus]|uniref:Uncharacterized protein n=1 Tax=Culter alburnus TaxID=194366 RepID=A0AAW1ZNX8_CULAL